MYLLAGGLGRAARKESSRTNEMRERECTFGRARQCQIILSRYFEQKRRAGDGEEGTYINVSIITCFHVDCDASVASDAGPMLLLFQHRISRSL